MPIYEYKCASCGHFFSVLFKTASEEEAVKCEKCGSADAQKKFSVFSKVNLSADIPECGGACAPSGGCASSGACPYA